MAGDSNQTYDPGDGFFAGRFYPMSMCSLLAHAILHHFLCPPTSAAFASTWGSRSTGLSFCFESSLISSSSSFLLPSFLHVPSPSLPRKAMPVSKLESGAHLPTSGLTLAQSKPDQSLATTSTLEPPGDIRVTSDNVRFGSIADI